MLLKANISSIEIHSDEWYQGRLAKFTASEIHNLMGEKPYQREFFTYVYNKVGEEMTGIAARDEADTAATRHGLIFENEAIRKYGESAGLSFVVVQKLISAPDSRFGCTPDFLVVHAEALDKTSYEVSTGEVKCPITYNAFIRLWLCDSPEDVLREEKKYFWQVVSQMHLCGALKGYLIIYHPDFKSGNMKVIEFRKVKLVKYFTLMAERLKLAEEKFIEIRDKFLAA